MAPVAARLSLGLEPERLGPPLERLIVLEWPQARLLEQRIARPRHRDRFLRQPDHQHRGRHVRRPADRQPRVHRVQHLRDLGRLCAAYAEQPQGTLVALVGSSGRLELAIVGDNAAARLGVIVGTPRGHGLGMKCHGRAYARATQAQWDRTLVWHAFTQMAEYEPLVIERGEGCMLFDIDGNAYLDGVSSLWCNIHGHRHPRLDAAIREQLDRVAHVTILGASNPTTIELARRLVDLRRRGWATCSSPTTAPRPWKWP